MILSRKALGRQTTKRSTSFAAKGIVVIFVSGIHDTGLAGDRTAGFEMVLQQVEDTIAADITFATQGVAFIVLGSMPAYSDSVGIMCSAALNTRDLSQDQD